MIIGYIRDLNKKLNRLILQAMQSKDQPVIDELSKGTQYLEKMGLSTVLHGRTIKAKLLHSAKTGNDDIKYFIAAFSHFKNAGLDVDLAEIFSSRIRTEGDMHLLDIATANNSVACILEILKISGMDWTGPYHYSGHCTLSYASNPEAAQILLNAGGGINIGIFGQEGILKYDLTDKVIFGNLILSNEVIIPITREIAIFKNAITNRFELAKAIRENRLSDEVIGNLKQAFLAKKTECSQVAKGFYIMFNYTLSFLGLNDLLDKQEVPNLHRYKNQELEHLDDILLILDSVKPNTSLKNIAFNSILKNGNLFFHQYQDKQQLPLPEDLKEELPSLEQAKRLTPYMN